MEQLGVFAKYWAPGAVKTRLAATVGPEAASRLARAFLATTLIRFARFPGERVLACTPWDQKSEFELLAGAQWRVEPQGAGDLGQRMDHYFQSAFSRGMERVILMGADSPTLPLSHLRGAWLALQAYQVVFVPATDGGYCLIGMARPAPEVFQGIAWSTADVLAQSLNRLGQLGLSYHCLPSWYDVDEIKDLRRLQHDLLETREGEDNCPELIQVVGEVLKHAE